MLDPNYYTLDVFQGVASNSFMVSREQAGRDLDRNLAAQLTAASAKAKLSSWDSDRFHIGQAVRAWLVDQGESDCKAGQTPVLEILARLDKAANSAQPEAGAAAMRDILRVFRELPSDNGEKSFSGNALLSRLAELGHSGAAARKALQTMVSDGRLRIRADVAIATSPKEQWQAGRGIAASGNARYTETPRLWEWERETGLPDSAIKQPQPKTTTKKRRLSKTEANNLALKALKNPKMRSVRKLAKGIGCSNGLAAKLPAWLAYQAELERRGMKKIPAPKTVSLDGTVLDNKGQDDEELELLIAEQQSGFEESPLVSNARNQRRRPKV